MISFITIYKLEIFFNIILEYRMILKFIKRQFKELVFKYAENYNKYLGFK